MKEILIWLGLIRPASSESHKVTVTFTTTYPEDQPSYPQWCKEFRVSMMHGKLPVYM